MYRFVLFTALLLLAGAAYAQREPAAAERSLAYSVQQIAASIELYTDDMKRRLAAKDHEIAELTRKCGDPCKPPEPPPSPMGNKRIIPE